jgi:hypothetical protein
MMTWLILREKDGKEVDRYDIGNYTLVSKEILRDGKKYVDTYRDAAGNHIFLRRRR